MLGQMLTVVLKYLHEAKTRWADRYEPSHHYMRGPGPKSGAARRRDEAQAR